MGIFYMITLALVMVSSLETAYLYLRWWPRVRALPNPPILHHLVLGIGILHLSVGSRAAWLYYEWAQQTHGLTDALPLQPVLTDSFVILSGASILFLVGTAFHLLPAWQIRNGWTTKSCFWHLAFRAIFVSLFAFLIARMLFA